VEDGLELDQWKRGKDEKKNWKWLVSDRLGRRMVRHAVWVTTYAVVS